VTDADNAPEQSDLSSWLSSLDNEPGLPFDKLPTPDSIMADKILKKETPPPPKTDMLGWLSDLEESQAQEAQDSWKPSVKEEAAPASAKLQEDLPDWLQDSGEEKASSAVDDVAPWDHAEKVVSAQPTPTQPSDWKPVEPKPVEPKPAAAPVKKAEPALAAPVQQAPKPVAPPPAAQPVDETPKKKKKPGLPARSVRQPESGTASLDQAKAELDRGDIPAALKQYGNLIKRGKHLDETIRDLTESLYRYPVEVNIWQALGDAYMRANRLKEALEAYNKAEELIR
jgi:tetratricopeptide (TPR) repeat protein